MEGYAAASNSANRKRPFRNVEREVPKLKKGVLPKRL